MHVLDAEITRVTSEQERSGWTLFAIIGATAAVSWSALGFWESGGFEIQEVVRWGLLLLSIRELAFSLFGRNSDPSWRPLGHRFIAARHFKSLGTYAAEAVFHATAFLVLIIFVVHRIPVWGTAAGLIYWAVSLLGAVVILIGPKLGIFVPLRSPKFETGASIGRFVLLLLLCISILGFAFALPTLHPGTQRAAFRLAVLLVALTELGRRLVAHSRSPRFLDTLIEIRKDLAFGRITPSEAIEQMEAEFTGSTLREVLEVALKELNEALGRVEQQMAALELALTPVLNSVLNSYSPTAQPQRIEMTNRAQALLEAQQRLTALSAELDTIVKRLTKSTQWLLIAPSEVRDEARLIVSQHEGSINGIRMRINRFAETVHQAKLLAERHLNPPEAPEQ
ncbi:MAG TPA: hypothetical protein VF746_21860 [Longimicrobium sp.]|jgi:hypothetical protein